MTTVIPCACRAHRGDVRCARTRPRLSAAARTSAYGRSQVTHRLLGGSGHVPKHLGRHAPSSGLRRLALAGQVLVEQRSDGRVPRPAAQPVQRVRPGAIIVVAAGPAERDGPGAELEAGDVAAWLHRQRRDTWEAFGRRAPRRTACWCRRGRRARAPGRGPDRSAAAGGCSSREAADSGQLAVDRVLVEGDLELRTPRPVLDGSVARTCHADRVGPVG